MEINDKQFKVFLGMVYYNLLLAVKEIGYMAVDWEYSWNREYICKKNGMCCKIF